MNHFTQKGIPVLCIHDSFISQEDRVEDLIDVMGWASEVVAGRPLAVEVKGRMVH